MAQGFDSPSSKTSSHLIAKNAKPWHMGLELSECTEIRQVSSQHCCQDACQISKWYTIYNTHSRSLETWQDLVVRCFTAYWIEALNIVGKHGQYHVFDAPELPGHQQLVFLTLYDKQFLLTTGAPFTHMV